MNEETGYKKYIGFFKAKIAAICPDSEWIQENFDDTLEEEPIYILEPKGRNGNKRVRIDIYLRDVKDNYFKYSIYLEDEVLVANSGANLYINQTGEAQYCKTEEQLFDSFKNFEDITWENGKPKSKKVIAEKSYRKAIKGEKQLTNLVKHIKDLNLKDTENTVLLNLNKLFEGNFSSLQDLIDDEKDFDFVAMIYIDEQGRQRVWENFLPLKLNSDLNNNFQISKYNKKIYEKFVEELSYLKGTYKLCKLQEFTEDMLPKKEDISQDGSDY